MASEARTIEVEPGGELDRLLDEADAAPLRLVRNGVGYRLNREAEDIWADYDPDVALAGILAAAGSWKDIDAEAFKAYVRERRRTKNRPSVRWSADSWSIPTGSSTPSMVNRRPRGPSPR